MRRTELASWDAVTHYRIHRLENGWLYISPRLTFPSLHDLVDHYSGKERQRSAPAMVPAGRCSTALTLPSPRRVWGGSVLHPQGALHHGGGKGSASPGPARRGEEANTQLGQN